MKINPFIILFVVCLTLCISVEGRGARRGNAAAGKPHIFASQIAIPIPQRRSDIKDIASHAQKTMEMKKGILAARSHKQLGIQGNKAGDPVWS